MNGVSMSALATAIEAKPLPEGELHWIERRYPTHRELNAMARSLLDDLEAAKQHQERCCHGR